MIAVTPLITPLAARIGTRLAIVAGFGLGRCSGSGRWRSSSRPGRYAALVLPLMVLSAGLGLANGPASSASTSPRVLGGPGGAGIRDLEHGAVHRRVGGGGGGRDDLQLGHGRGGPLRARRRSEALAAGLSRAALLMAILCAPGYRARAAHGPPSAGAPDGSQPRRGSRGGRLAHDPHSRRSNSRRHLSPVVSRSLGAALGGRIASWERG